MAKEELKTLRLKIQEANQAIASLKMAVAIGDEKSQTYIDIFEPVVQYATEKVKSE